MPMPLSKFLPVLTALLLFCASLGAQVTFDGDDAAFFNGKAKNYQRWLDNTGIGRVLQVSEWRLKKDSTELELFLLVKSTDLDTAISMWSQLKKDFQSSADRPPLEEKLFRTFVDFMEIPAEQGNIQVYVKDADGKYIPCFFVAVSESAGTVKYKEEIGKCKSELGINIAITPISVRKVAGKNTTAVPRRLSTAQVFGAIENFIRRQYGSTQCFDRTPTVEVKKEGSTLHVTVENLCRVVLTKEKESLWCGVMNAMGISCNDMRRERLEFRFAYQEGSNLLTGSLSGKFGSGVYVPREKGYFDMEPDFSEFINSFHRGFQAKLKEQLDQL